ncbi:hypothetical protein Ciccas_005688 [Cichlidogyrus casuarinus]|uniref:Valine--tRNA ligase n=1 Tax=Cichlidogyrus casuarinus TaxID=1844966 RepID=A0ABD2Q7Z4_9PLAT
MSEPGDDKKTKNQLKNEAKKAAKLEKFNLKKEKIGESFGQVNTLKKVSEKVTLKKESVNVEAKADETGKKIVNRDVMPDAYSPKYVEKYWYSWWEKSGFFKPEYHSKLKFPKSNEKFVMVIPPPNVTGTLHLGHALTNSVEDAITRWHRMRGEKTLWLPGCDHAGIATQVVVEKKLMRTQQKSRHDLGREAFVNEVWKWKEEKGHEIYNQLRLLGSSCDWDRQRFTMDPDMTRAVIEAFVQLYDRGLIYRSVRLVNWSCALKSAISDIEVDKMTIEGRTPVHVPGFKKAVDFGIITSFAYPLEDESLGEIVVATTRIETMLGDSGIAVHPQDERFTKYVGKYAKHPFIEDRKIIIVADEMVDRDFGTGAVKLTPAHDQNDWEAGQRHNLPVINILNDDGTLNDKAGPRFAGMHRFEARTAVRKALEELKLLRGDQDNPMVVPLCSRTKDVIEPMLKPQWYLKCQGMADRATKAVADGELEIVPDLHVRTWNSWLSDCHDWCISRQLWWGHRIPVYLVGVKDKSGVVNMKDATDSNNWIAARSQEEALDRASKKLGQPVSEFVVSQDEDVLDTWFSSQLFPFASFGWPDLSSSDLAQFFPGTLLETGHDIIFFWVARMVMISLELCDKLPFKTVYLHAMVRDAHGKKMSKSLGNAIDPLDVMWGISLPDLQAKLETGNLDPKELKRARDAQQKDFPDGIPECGADALRFALCAYTAQGRNINLDILRVQGYRHFCNKLWNACKFVLFHALGSTYVPPASFHSLLNEPKSDYAKLAAMDKWILLCLANVVRKCDLAFKSYNFPDATTALYDFWLYQLCDIYLEYAKSKKDTAREVTDSNVAHILYTCLELGLRLMHPFMPFVTEELFQHLPARPSDAHPESICVSQYPIPEQLSSWTNEASTIQSDFQMCYDIVRYLRSIFAQYNLTKQTKTQKPFVQLAFSCERLLSRCSSSGLIVDCVENLGKVQVVLTTSDKSAIDQQGCLHSTIFQTSGPEANTAGGEHCLVYIRIAELIDLKQELTKNQNRISNTEKSIQALGTKIAHPNYESKVPLETRELNAAKMKELEVELQHLMEMDENLKSMLGTDKLTNLSVEQRCNAVQWSNWVQQVVNTKDTAHLASKLNWLAKNYAQLAPVLEYLPELRQTLLQLAQTKTFASSKSLEQLLKS